MKMLTTIKGIPEAMTIDRAASLVRANPAGVNFQGALGETPQEWMEQGFQNAMFATKAATVAIFIHALLRPIAAAYAGVSGYRRNDNDVAAGVLWGVGGLVFPILGSATTFYLNRKDK